MPRLKRASDVSVFSVFDVHLFGKSLNLPDAKHFTQSTVAPAIAQVQPFSVVGEQNGQREVSAEVHGKPALKFQSRKLLNKETKGRRGR